MISFVAVTTATYIVLSLTFDGAITAFDLGFTPQIAAGGVLVLSLLFGPAAAWGSAIGYLGVDVVQGVLGFSSTFGAVGHFLPAYLSYNLWGNLGSLSSGSEPTMRSPQQIGEYLLVAFISLVALIAITAWGNAVLGILPYFITVAASFINHLIPAVIIGPPALYFLYPRLRAKDLSYHGISESEPSMWHIYVTSFLLLSWVLLGSVISIGYQIYQQVPYQSFVRRDLEFLRTLAGIAFGSTGGRIQAVLGSILFSALLLVLIYRGGFGRVDRTTKE